MVRTSKVKKGLRYVRDRRCSNRLPPVPLGQIPSYVRNACGGFWGVRDQWPDVEVVVSIERAREILAVGMARQVIELAMGR